MAIEAKKRRRRLERRWKSSNEEHWPPCLPSFMSFSKCFESQNHALLQILSASMKPQRTRGVFGLPSRPSSIHQLQWATLTLCFKAISGVACIFFQTKDNFTQTSHLHLNQMVHLHLSILISLTTNTYSQSTQYTPVTPLEVSKLLHSMSGKSSPLDFIPTSLLKSCSDTFSILIARFG